MPCPSLIEELRMLSRKACGLVHLKTSRQCLSVQDLAGSEVTIQSAQDGKRMLSAGKELVRLELSDNPMTAEVAEELAETIRAQPKLQSLILNDISLCGDDNTDGLAQICAALTASAPHLEELELALNEISVEGAKVSVLSNHQPRSAHVATSLENLGL